MLRKWMKKADELLSALLRRISILVIVLLLSAWVWMILFLLSIHIGIFLHVFIDYPKHILQYLFFILVASAAVIVTITLINVAVDMGEGHRSLAPFYEKKDEKCQKWYLLSFYITCLLSIPFVIHLLFWILHPQESSAFLIRLDIIYEVSILIFFVFALLKLCLKHPVVDILLLVWAVISITLMVSKIVALKYTHINIGLILSIVNLIGGLIPLVVLLSIIVKLLRKREINLNAIIRATKESVKELMKLLLSLARSIKNQVLFLKKILKRIIKIDPFYDPNLQMANKMYLLLVVTFTLFTVGTVFIVDFTRAMEYNTISQNITLCTYNISPYTQNITLNLLNISSSCIPYPNSTLYPNSIRFICSLHHKIGIKDNLTLIKSEIENRSTFYPIDTFCTQYEQNKRDFITYFSALIVATITFFVMMYEKFIRKKEDTKN